MVFDCSDVLFETYISCDKYDFTNKFLWNISIHNFNLYFMQVNCRNGQLNQQQKWNKKKCTHTHIQTDIQTHMSNQNEMAILNAFWILFDWTSGVNTHMWTASDCINHFMLFIEMVGIINLIYKIEQLAEFMSLYTIFLCLSLCLRKFMLNWFHSMFC